MSEQNLVNWLDSFLNAGSINGDLDMLPRMYLNWPFEILPTLLDCVYGPAVDDRCRTLPYREHLSPA